MAEGAQPTKDLATVISQLDRHGPHDIPFADSIQRNLEHIEKKWRE
jgi:hypothetical protein